MRAIAYDTFGSPDVLELRELPAPTVSPGHVLVRVRAVSPNPWDWHFLRGLPYIARLAGAGLLAPAHPILGRDVAGVVEAVGEGVTRFSVGDEVFGLLEAGGLAELASAPEGLLAHKPSNLTFAQAATLPLAALTALQGLRDAGGIRAGQRVLIVGASGGVGTFAVQLAKSFGASVTGVSSGRNEALVRALGADHVIDYEREDVTQRDERYDLVLQLAGTAPASALRQLLVPDGTLVLSSGESADPVLGPFTRMIGASLLSMFTRQSLRVLTTEPRTEDLELLRTLVEAGAVTPVIDRTYPLERAADAIRYLETGRARGKVVIAVA